MRNSQIIALLFIFIFVGCIPELSKAPAPIETTPSSALPNPLSPPPQNAITLSPTPYPNQNPDLSIRENANTQDMLFLFNSAFGFHYDSLNPLTKASEEIFLTERIGISNMVSTATTLSFSNFSNKVAFWVRMPNQHGALWLADIELKEAKLIYQDTQQLFSSDLSFPPKDVYLDWFPNDKYVLLKPVNPTNQNSPILIDVTLGDYQENWSWACNAVVVSPKTAQLALLCQGNGETLIVEWGGEMWLLNPVDGHYEVIFDWQSEYMLPLSSSGTIPSWSFDGSKIAFVSDIQPNNLEIFDTLGGKSQILLEVDMLFAHTIRWTVDGNILVAGYSEACAICWFLINSESGEILWALEDTANFDFTSSERQNLFFLRGEISSSSEYLVLATHRQDVPSGNQLILIDIENNKLIGTVADIGHGIDSFSWGLVEADDNR